MGGAIEREALAVAAGEVGLIGEDGSDVLCAGTAGKGGDEFDFEMDEQRGGGAEKQVAGLCALDGAAAEGQDQRVAGCKAGNGCVFAVAEWDFAVAREELGDACAGFLLDYFVHVDETPAQASGDKWANGAFARTHESGEDDAARRYGGDGFRGGLGGGVLGHVVWCICLLSHQYKELRCCAWHSGENHDDGSGGDEQAAGDGRGVEFFAQEQPGEHHDQRDAELVERSHA
jgi:hypothetical protein